MGNMNLSKGEKEKLYEKSNETRWWLYIYDYL